jgi:hypothetical protein
MENVKIFKAVGVWFVAYTDRKGEFRFTTAKTQAEALCIPCEFVKEYDRKHVYYAGKKVGTLYNNMYRGKMFRLLLTNE